MRSLNVNTMISREVVNNRGTARLPGGNRVDVDDVDEKAMILLDAVEQVQ